ncbi:hypothetical protein P4O66_003689 [Electrophorus voltai]|uniref:Uncharacterized protein n=1 Tax=Electrophorus voltai TaxID=2609070 RepID=A0AAD9DJ27_9TELE|nr:hypothetical protein P4O66_003689 [Electrophorus voltai]
MLAFGYCHHILSNHTPEGFVKLHWQSINTINTTFHVLKDILQIHQGQWPLKTQDGLFFYLRRTMLGVTGSAWKWFQSYLEGRSYQVCCVRSLSRGLLRKPRVENVKKAAAEQMEQEAPMLKKKGFLPESKKRKKHKKLTIQEDKDTTVAPATARGGVEGGKKKEEKNKRRRRDTDSTSC